MSFFGILALILSITSGIAGTDKRWDDGTPASHGSSSSLIIWGNPPGKLTDESSLSNGFDRGAIVSQPRDGELRGSLPRRGR